MLAAHDFVLAVGTSVFPYYPNVPGPLLAEGTTLVAITSDPDEAARAPMGDAILADPGLTLAALADAVGESERRAAAGPRRRRADHRPDEPLDRRACACQAFPQDGIVVLESPSATLALRNQLRLSKPGSYYFSSGGGLGLRDAGRDRRAAGPAEPSGGVRDRRGLGPVCDPEPVDRRRLRRAGTFLVLRNDEYAILKWFGMLEDTSDAPGLDLPALDAPLSQAATASTRAS